MTSDFEGLIPEYIPFENEKKGTGIYYDTFCICLMSKQFRNEASI